MVAVLRGAVSYRYDGTSVDLTAAQINVAANSGALRLSLVLGTAPATTTTPPSYRTKATGPSIASPASGAILTAQDTGALALDVATLPTGTYYPVLYLEEYLGVSAQNPDGWGLRDWAVFNTPFLVTGAVGGQARFVGSVGYTASATTIDFKLAKIYGPLSGTSGSLQVSLFLSSAPFDAQSPANQTAGVLSLNPLPALSTYSSVDQVVQKSTVASGSYYATIVLQEYSNNHFQVDDYVPLSTVYVEEASTNSGSGVAAGVMQGASSSTLQSGSLTTGTGPAGSVSGDLYRINATTIGVYRFFDSTYGTHFFTASASEQLVVSFSRSDLVSEGIGLAAIDPAAAASDTAATSVYRFFDKQYGTHFFTSSTTERDAVQATRPDLTYEGIGFYEHGTPQSGDVAVHRFFDTSRGTHFYTADANEYASIKANRLDLTHEGVGFYAPSVN